MKLSAISDLHVDINGCDRVMDAVLGELEARRSDALLIPGDISSHHVLTLSFLAELRERAGIPVLWAPGNHDLWSKEDPTLSAQDILQAYGEDEGYLHGVRSIGSGLYLVGGFGWYDYSLGDDQFSYDRLKERRHMGRVWQDSLYAKFGMSDAELHDREIRRFRSELNRLPADATAILMTHMVSHRRFTVPKLADYPEWEYFNAFLGSLALFEAARHPAVRVVLCGHVHHRTRFTEEGRDYICCCLGYKSEFPRFGPSGLADNVAQAMQDFVM